MKAGDDRVLKMLSVFLCSNLSVKLESYRTHCPDFGDFRSVEGPAV